MISRFLSSRPGQALKEPLRKSFERTGYDVVPLRRDDTLRLGALLDAHGVASVIDVGANQGQYARRMRLMGFAGHIVSVEPGAAAFRLLAQRAAGDANWTVWQVALGGVDGTASLRVSRNSVSSSLLDVAETHLSAAPESKTHHLEAISVRRLDDVARAISGPLWLKVDTQGYELEVLAGGKETLARTAILQLELSLTSLYTGQPDYLEVLRCVNEDFRVVDVIPGFRSPVSGDLLQVDVLAVRSIPKTPRASAQ